MEKELFYKKEWNSFGMIGLSYSLSKLGFKIYWVIQQLILHRLMLFYKIKAVVCVSAMI